MKNYLMDTDICIYFINGKYDLRRKLKKIEKKRLFISEITVAELKFGAENSKNVEQNKKIIEKFINSISTIPIKKCINTYANKKQGFEKKVHQLMILIC